MSQFPEQEPKYRRLLETLRTEIQQGIYQVHDRIPSEKELRERFDVSRVTVRRALKELTDEGLLVRYQGKGTFVSMPKIQRDLKSVTSFHASCTLMGLTGSARVISSQMTAPGERDMKELQLDADARVVEIRRLCMADGEPVMLEINHFSEEYAWLLEEDLSASLYGLLAEKKIEPDKAIHEISLCRADDVDARYLDTEKGEALLCVEETIFDQKGRPLHTSLQHIRADRFTFRI
ncbi:MAG: GntR family transcriptional regulator [Clostridia bacterium]|nr:GntR family transcriptional regulator [Clostridia bacterium]